MAVPKRKLSRSRTRRRRAQWLSRTRPAAARCQQCRAPVRPHTVCHSCGAYGGRQVIDVAE
ncbi:50S ribosomal protein L32 [Egibacter rhizosphaerae]|uniref:Large ribosomal subunit protein bL32 n=1 Tax=Egibacter rhizosphaerae TaxID=1670831 RepID=A0A411YCP3_9ACTN|nr:50S ribosomal protein L32 [Egibacter rhizosphaerae]